MSDEHRLYDEYRHPGAYVLVKHRRRPVLARFNDLPWCQEPPPGWIRVGDTPATRGERDGMLLPCFWDLPIVYPARDWCGLCKDRMATHIVYRHEWNSEADYEVCDQHAAYYRQIPNGPKVKKLSD